MQQKNNFAFLPDIPTIAKQPLTLRGSGMLTILLVQPWAFPLTNFIIPFDTLCFCSYRMVEETLVVSAFSTNHPVMYPTKT